MDDDLNLIMMFLESQHQGMRLDLFNYPNTGGWRADCATTFGFGKTPMMAVEDLFKKLKHNPVQLNLWIKKKVQVALDD